MKRFLSLVLALALAATAFVGCGETKPADSTESTPAPEVNIESEFFLSDYFNEDGFFKDINLADYVTLPDYKNAVIPKAHYIPGETTVQLEIEKMLSSHATKETLTEGVVEDGDTLNIGYVGTVDGVAFNGGSTGPDGTEVTIGVTQYIDDFLQQLVGHEVGETFDIEVTFPDDYGKEDLAGKDATFMITINYIVEPIAAKDLTDEIVAEKFGDQGIETVEQLREESREYLASTMIGNYIYTEIFGKSNVETVAQTAIDFQTEYIILSTSLQAESYGLTFEEMLSYYGMGTKDEFLEYYAETIENSAKEICITQAIAEKEGIVVEKADIEEYFGGENYKSVEQIYGANFVKFLVLQGKTLDYLTENTTRG